MRQSHLQCFHCLRKFLLLWGTKERKSNKMDNNRAILKGKWNGGYSSVETFEHPKPLLQLQVPYAAADPLQLNQGWSKWFSQGYTATTTTTSQYDVFMNRVVGGFHPRIRTRGVYLYDLDAIPFDPNIDVPMKVCFNCWQQGHREQKCFQLKTHVFCDNCGRIDVTVDKCPRCSRAYKRFLLEKQACERLGIHTNANQVLKCLELPLPPKAWTTPSNESPASNGTTSQPTVLSPKVVGNQRDPSTHLWRFTGKANGGLFKNINQIPFDPKVDVPYGVCFNCWGYGHSRQNCPEPDRKDHCRNCGRIGVKIINCPRCSDAYRRYWKVQSSFEHDKLQEDVSQVEAKENLDRESCDVHLQFIAKQLAEDRHENYDDMIVDENEESYVITGTFLDCFMHLTNAMKFLPFEEQKIVAQNFVREHIQQQITLKKS